MDSPGTQPDRKDTQKGKFSSERAGQASWLKLDIDSGDIPEQCGPQSLAEASNAMVLQQAVGQLGGHGMKSSWGTCH